MVLGCHHARVLHYLVLVGGKHMGAQGHVVLVVWEFLRWRSWGGEHGILGHFWDVLAFSILLTAKSLLRCTSCPASFLAVAELEAGDELGVYFSGEVAWGDRHGGSAWRVQLVALGIWLRAIFDALAFCGHIHHVLVVLVSLISVHRRWHAVLREGLSRAEETFFLLVESLVGLIWLKSWLRC